MRTIFDTLKLPERNLHVRQTQIDAARIEELERERDALQADNAELVAALETVIANAPEPYCAITRAVDAQCRAALAKVRKP